MGSAELNLRARARLGTTLRGKYRLERVLGVGGMAVVYKATHRNRAEFAVKMLLPELSNNDEIRARFLREGYAANSVKHAGVVAVVDDDTTEDGSAFVVMELLDGMNVDELAAKHGGRLPVQIAVSIGCQLLDVIASAHHNGILHRDLKPANVFATTTGQVKVLDFGIARVRDAASGSSHATQSGVSFGTPAFMAPEQARGKTKEVNELSDVWAIGAALFTLITGSLVHEGDNSTEVLVKAATEPARRLRTVAAQVPPQIADVIDRALAFAPQERWTSAAAMRDALLASYAACFASPPSHADIAAFLAGTPVAPATSIDNETRKVEHGAEPASAGPAVGGTTAVPVETERHHAGRNRGILVAAICGGGVLVVGAVAIFSHLHANPPASAATSPSLPTTPDSLASLAPVAPPPAPSGSPPPPTLASTPSAPLAHAVVPDAPTERRPPVAIPAATPTRRPATTPRPDDCNPNYTLDRDGNKHFKPECF